MNWRSFLYLTFSHVASSALVVAYNWDAINRRFHRYTTDFVLSYTLLSLIILIFMILIRRLKNGALTACFLPYFASTIAYVFVMRAGLIKEIIRLEGVDYLNLLGIILIAPYLVAWGPVISLISALALWLLNRNMRNLTT